MSGTVRKNTGGKKKKKMPRAGLVALLVVLFAVLLCGGALAVFGTLAHTSGVIYPNVSACGVQLGGMTVEQAAAALAESDWNVYAGKSVTVRFPGETELTITAEEAGLVGDETEMAQRVFDYGRDGGFLSWRPAAPTCTTCVWRRSRLPGGSGLPGRCAWRAAETIRRSRI